MPCIREAIQIRGILISLPIKNMKKLILATTLLASTAASAFDPLPSFSDYMAAAMSSGPLPGGSVPVVLSTVASMATSDGRFSIPIQIGIWEEGGANTALFSIASSTEDTADKDFYFCQSPSITAQYIAATNKDTFKISCNLTPFDAGFEIPSVHGSDGTSRKYQSIDLSFERPKGKLFAISTGSVPARFKVYERTSGTATGTLKYMRNGSLTSSSLNPQQLAQEYFTSFDGSPDTIPGYFTLDRSIVSIPNGSTYTFYANVNLPNMDEFNFDIATLKQKYEITAVATHADGYVMPLFNFYVASTSTDINSIKMIMPYSFPSGWFNVSILVKDKKTGKQYAEKFIGSKL